MISTLPAIGRKPSVLLVELALTAYRHAGASASEKWPLERLVGPMFARITTTYGRRIRRVVFW